MWCGYVLLRNGAVLILVSGVYSGAVAYTCCVGALTLQNDVVCCVGLAVCNIVVLCAFYGVMAQC